MELQSPLSPSSLRVSTSQYVIRFALSLACCTCYGLFASEHLLAVNLGPVT